jgi:uncharacterized protein (TIGR02246 family)
MKKFKCFLFVAVIIISAFQSKAQTKPVDLDASKASVNTLMDKYLNAFTMKDAKTMPTLLAEDGLFCGTDPSEFWDKKALSDMWNQMAADTVNDYHYSVDKREIRVAKDGNSAVVIEQFTMPLLSQKIPIRTIYHIVKEKDKWLIDFLCFNFIPKNEDIPKLNKALE